MMAKQKYTEEDIQSYIDGSFKGDSDDLKIFIAENQGALGIFNAYSAIINSIQQEETFALPFDLAHSVTTAIEARKIENSKKAKAFSHILPAFIVCVAIAAFFLSIPSGILIPKIPDSFLIIVCLIILIFFVTSFHLLELHRKKQIYQRLS